MNNKDALKRKVDELKQQAEEIEEIGIKLLEEVPFNSHEFGFFSAPDYHTPLKNLQREAILKYQQWYSTCLRLVDENTPEWREEFKLRYHYPSSSNSIGVAEYLNLDIGIPFLIREQGINEFVHDLEAQLSILLSIPSIIEVKEMSLQELITADVARTEIEQAEILLESCFERAAGSIAGVALELYLKTQCEVNGVSYPPKATIEPLAQALYKENKLNITEFKRIQYLGSIRNKCSHSEPVSAKEIQSLIDGVKKLI
jgi:hypothetical protein